MLTGSNVIYALVKQDVSRDVVLEFDGQLREDVKNSFHNFPLEAETAAMSWLSNSRVAAGHEYGVDILSNGSSFLRALSTDVPVKAVCEDAGVGFYFIEQSESEGTYITTLKHYSSGEVSTLFTNTEGRTCRLVRDGDNGIFGAIAGDEVLVFRMADDELIGEYNSEMLGSLPAQIVISNVTGSDKSNSSGCSISGIGMMLFLAGVCILSKRH